MRYTILVAGVVLILFILVGSVVLQLSGTMPRAQIDQQRIWDAPIAGGEVETLKVIDLTGDGQDEIFAQTPSQVAVFTSEGRTLFSQNLSSAKSTMGDMDGNGVEDFAIAEPQGNGLHVVAYTGDGGRLWENIVPDVGAPTRGLTLDFEGDGKREVIFGSDAGVLVVLEGDTGELRWLYTFSPDTPENLYVRGTDDARQAGVMHLAGATYGGDVVLLDGVGATAWEILFPDEVRRLRAYDMNGDGTSEILLGGLNGLVWMVSAAGDNNLLWQTSIGSRVDEARFLELDGDPTQTEVAIGGKNGGVSAYTVAGTTLWQRTVAGKVRELATLDTDDDGQNELLVAADKVYLLDGRTGNTLSTFPVGAPPALDTGDFGGTQGYVADTGGKLSVFRVSYKPRPWWSSPITIGLLLALIIAVVSVVLARIDWDKGTVYNVQGQSLEALRAKKRMLRDVLDDTQRVYADGQISAQVYLEKSRQEREQLAAVEEQILKLNPDYKPEVFRCPACAGPVEIGMDQCPYCNHVLL
jgi:outer membrane protein assembly factor BamB